MSLLRSGRSTSGRGFLRERPGPPILSKHPYSFADVLAYNNHLVLNREDNDVAYRGAKHSFAQCTDSTCIIHFYPDGDYEPAPVSSPESRAASPASTDLFASDTEHDDAAVDDSDGAARAPSPTVTELGGSAAPTRPPRYTLPYYAALYIEQRQDLGRARWERYFASKEVLEVLELGVKLAKEKQAVEQRISELESPPRKSRRQRQGRRGDLSEYGVVRAEVLLHAGFLAHHVGSGGGPRALVDRNAVVTGVVSGGPIKYAWKVVHNHIYTDLRRLLRNGEFWRLGAGESRVRGGLTSGYPHDQTQGPAFIPLAGVNAIELSHIQQSEAFQLLAGFQTHTAADLMQQFFPDCSAVASHQVAELLRLRPDLSTPFPDCPFTTYEINFTDAPMLSRKNRRATFYLMQAITAVGKYNDLEGGELILDEDDACIRFSAGMTTVLPATTEYRFAAVGKDEDRYLFRQYFCAGALRWAEKGGRTDEQFEKDASEEEKQAWEDTRVNRGMDTYRLFSQFHEIDV
ncbi:hypothetical protein R3P38DRAFT_3235635 [Favolaschia claudopus]|uniref:Uncharacterized protein n=1 Tax=Favolaschia claudopus TaxID=2862362 RepID=A0AAV9ZET6_9AGAR